MDSQLKELIREPAERMSASSHKAGGEKKATEGDANKSSHSHGN